MELRGLVSLVCFGLLGGCGGSTTGTESGFVEDTGASGADGTGASDDASGGGDPFAAEPTCTSGATWTSGDRGSQQMHPGMACIGCHAKDFRAPKHKIAGTVFPTAHEPDDCVSKVSGLQVVITGADGKALTLTPNASGNFFSLAPVAMPYTAKVVSGGKERAMLGEQSNGDCNACHTQAGKNGAPGRIIGP
jgi:hypothetical protein